MVATLGGALASGDWWGQSFQDPDQGEWERQVYRSNGRGGDGQGGAGVVRFSRVASPRARLGRGLKEARERAWGNDGMQSFRTGFVDSLLAQEGERPKGTLVFL